MLVSLVEGFLEWINQYWKECPWSSTGNCFTLFSSLFSVFVIGTTYFLQRWFLIFFGTVVGHWDFWQAWRGRAWACIQGEWSFTAICMYAMCNICCEQQADFLFFLYQFVGNVHGDEPVGRELLLRLANWICDNYIKDSLVFLFIHYMSASKVFELYFAVYLLLLLFFVYIL